MEETKKEGKRKITLPHIQIKNLGMWILGILLSFNLVLTGYSIWEDKHTKHSQNHSHSSNYGDFHESYTSCINGRCETQKNNRELTQRDINLIRYNMIERQKAFDKYFYEQRKIMDEFWKSVW